MATVGFKVGGAKVFADKLRKVADAIGDLESGAVSIDLVGESAVGTEKAADAPVPKTEKAAKPADAPKPPTVDDARSALQAVIKAKGREVASSLLAKHGVTKVPDLKPEQYEGLIADAKVALA